MMLKLSFQNISKKMYEYEMTYVLNVQADALNIKQFKHFPEGRSYT